MNREWVLHNLGEARGELSTMIVEMHASRNYDYAEFWVTMQHVYHYLNTAWNSREATAQEVEEATDEDFNRWSQFPADLPMMKI
jgi:hypothetical protein